MVGGEGGLHQNFNFFPHCDFLAGREKKSEKSRVVGAGCTYDYSISPSPNLWIMTFDLDLDLGLGLTKILNKNCYYVLRSLELIN